MAPKFLLLLAAALLSAPAAFAEPSKPAAYEQLTASPQKPGQAPRLVHGVSDLSGRESRHREHLPMQLEGAMGKVKRAKYAPKRERSLRKNELRTSAKKVSAPVAHNEARKSPQKSRVKTVSIEQKNNNFEEALPMPKAIASDIDF